MDATEYGPISLRYSGKPVGVEVLGVDLSQAVLTATFAAIESLFNDNGMIFFRGQKLTPCEQLAFSSRFGRLERHVRQEYALPGHPKIHLILNVKESERSIGSAYAGDAWHTDLCFMREPSRCSLLYALEVPEKNGRPLGDTQFASTQYAYDTLPAELKSRIAGMRGVQQYHRRQEIKRAQRAADHARQTLTAAQKAGTPDVTQLMVRTHSYSGRKCLYVNETYTFGIEGMPESGAQPLLKLLCEHVTRAEYVYSHQWQVGDLVIWR